MNYLKRNSRIILRREQEITKEFPVVQGFSKDNLWRMRNFYLAYQKNEKLAPLLQEIGWTYNIYILEHCGDDLEREFYIKTTKKFGWTKDVLINQLEVGALSEGAEGRRLR